MMAQANEALFERTEILVGTEGVQKLKSTSVIIFGAGGVGSFVMEGLARMGIGTLILVDFDEVSGSNLNRQLPALIHTLGQSKVQVMAERIRNINPSCDLQVLEQFIHPEDIEPLLKKLSPDYVVDCIDTLNVKVNLIQTSAVLGFPVITSMGAGNKLNPVGIKVDDIYKTKVCHLARAVRQRLRRYGQVKKGQVTAIFSEEVPRKPLPPEGESEEGRPRAVNGTVSYLPALFGLTLTGVVVNKILESGD